jgi:drug/metabolite transporter (DMT)-like permease
MLGVCLIKVKSSSLFKFKLSMTEVIVLVTCGLSAGVVFNLIMLAGLRFTHANNAGLITSLLPAIVIVLNITLFKQKMTRKMLVSLIISISGLALINYSATASGSSQTMLGDWLVLASLLPEGLYYALSKAYPLNLNSYVKVFALNAVNLPILYLIVFWHLPSSAWASVVIGDWLQLGIIGLTSALFFILWQYGIIRIDAAYSALATAFMPVATVILAWLVLGETINLSKLLGMLLVISAILVYALPFSKLQQLLVITRKKPII